MPAHKSSAHRPISQGQAERLAINIREARVALDLSQERLAELSGLSVQHIRRLEGGTSNPTVGSLEAIALVLDKALAELLV